MAEARHVYSVDVNEAVLKGALCGAESELPGQPVCHDCLSIGRSDADRDIVAHLNEYGEWLVDQSISLFHRFTPEEILLKFIEQSPSWSRKEEPADG